MQNINKGIVKHDNYFTHISEDDIICNSITELSEDEIFSFLKGDVVHILAKLQDSSYGSGIAYVILNELNESVTVDSSLIDIIK